MGWVARAWTLQVSTAIELFFHVGFRTRASQTVRTFSGNVPPSDSRCRSSGRAR